MRRARYSKQAPRSTDWGAIVRNLVIALVLLAAGWWLLSGPAQGWLSAFSSWLNSL